jgi:hypothetical protein
MSWPRDYAFLQRAAPLYARSDCGDVTKAYLLGISAAFSGRDKSNWNTTRLLCLPRNIGLFDVKEVEKQSVDSNLRATICAADSDSGRDCRHGPVDARQRRMWTRHFSVRQSRLDQRAHPDWDQLDL